MKIHHAVTSSTTIVIVVAVLTALGVSEGRVQGTTSTRPHLKDPFSSSCNGLDKNSCVSSKDDHTHDFCVWCVAGAVPSECVNPEQAKILPESVFDCTTPGGSSSHDAKKKEEKKKEKHVLTFDTVADTKYHLTVTNHDENEDSDFCDSSSKSRSGYMDIKGSKYDENGENKHLFFWMFEKRGGDAESDDDTPFIVWLTGGPGCSSSLALLTENGPCSVNDDGETTSVNPNSWTEAAHVLWLDQPAGVGFSYGTENDYNEAMIAEDAYYFLQAFFKTYPQYAKNPFFIVGESYGGHYAPAIARRVHHGNKQISDNDTGDKIHINLSGVGVGNGLTKPEEQYKWYPEMGYNNSHGIQVFSEDTYETMEAIVPKCQALIHKCNEGDSMVDEFACQTAFVVCNMGLTSPYQATGLNPYDIRIPCEVPPLCYDMSHINHWFHLVSTKKALGVDEEHSHAWSTCNFGINMKFHDDWMKDFSPAVAELLNADIPVLIYAGDVDFICNYLGNKAWTYNLEWKGKDEFQAAKEHDYANGAGLTRTTKDGLFTFLQVYDAGHMVPSDKPEVALEMIRNFINGGKF